MKKTFFADSEYDQLIALGLRLGIPIPLVHIEFFVHLEGRRLSHFRDRSRTVNRNYWNMILNCLTRALTDPTTFGAGYYNFKVPAGTVPGSTPNSYQWDPIGIINNSDYGFLVGRGSAAEDFESWKLDTPITHGTGANQLLHAVMPAVTKAYVPATKTWTFTFSRAFTNSSGAQIDITESAWYYNAAGAGIKAMINRDLLSETIPVPNLGVLTAVYTISLALPA